MKYAIIRLQGQQFKVEEGDEILVNYLGDNKPEAETLILRTDKEIKVGMPTVEKAAIKISVLSEEEKGKKLYVSKYKAKSRYRKRIGFRPKFTRVKIDKIA